MRHLWVRISRIFGAIILSKKFPPHPSEMTRQLRPHICTIFVKKGRENKSPGGMYGFLRSRPRTWLHSRLRGRGEKTRGGRMNRAQAKGDVNRVNEKRRTEGECTSCRCFSTVLVAGRSIRKYSYWNLILRGAELILTLKVGPTKLDTSRLRRIWQTGSWYASALLIAIANGLWQMQPVYIATLDANWKYWILCKMFTDAYP